MGKPPAFLKHHKTKCRICFKYFMKHENPIKITEFIKTTFFHITQIKIKGSSKVYSQVICSVCNKKLDEFAKYRRDLRLKQKRLYEFVDQDCPSDGDEEEIAPLKVDVKQERNILVTENCVLIKTEGGQVGDLEDFNPLEHLYDFTENIKQEPLENEQFNTSSSEFLTTENLPEKRTKKNRFDFSTLPKIPKTPKTTYSCEFCTRKFTHPESLEIHVNHVHLKNKNIKCDLCNFKTSNPKYLKSHIARVHEGTPQTPKLKKPCPICGVFVLSVSEHTRAVHLREKSKFCDICGFGDFKIYRIRMHMNKHMSKETKRMLASYHCDICGVILGSKNSIINHMKQIHLNDSGKVYKCYCGAVLKTATTLAFHQKNHEKVANHVCPYCGKAFKFQCSLKTHMEIHNRREKTFFCEFCGKSFYTLELLTKHKIFHTEPTLECEFCSKKFHKNSFLDKHIKKNHKIEVAPCQICGKVLNVVSMMRHIKEMHSGLPKYHCPIDGCKGSYTRREYIINQHLKRMHKDLWNRLTPDERMELEAKIKSD